MLSEMMSLVVAVSVFAAADFACRSCDAVSTHGFVRSAPAVAQLPDTATTRLRISGMTCRTCPLTARVAIKKLAGVYAAVVTFDDSLGVVRYDPKRVTPAEIAAHLTKLTGYKATVLPDTAKAARNPDTR
ncbi:MAG: cation transporter [Gemmatimonadaceae bacterium]